MLNCLYISIRMKWNTRKPVQICDDFAVYSAFGAAVAEANNVVPYRTLSDLCHYAAIPRFAESQLAFVWLELNDRI